MITTNQDIQSAVHTWIEKGYTLVEVVIDDHGNVEMDQDNKYMKLTEFCTPRFSRFVDILRANRKYIRCSS
jgi:hypothetical protein